MLNTVGPKLSDHRLSGYLYYLAMILQCILSIFHSFPSKFLIKTKTKVDEFLFYFILYQFYMNNNLLQIQQQ